MTKQKETDPLEVITDLSQWVVFMITILSAIVLTVTGTVAILYEPAWSDFLYFIGAGLSFGFHYLFRVLLVAGN